MSSSPTLQEFTSKRESIVVIGLGYVGLPLAHLLATKFSVTGLDINLERVAELRAGFDRTRELGRDQLAGSMLTYSTDPTCIREARFIIVTVPTPIDSYKKPDLHALAAASSMIGRHIQPGTTVVYESTVYPGCTEEDCIPLVEKESGLKWKTDFFIGYSPERINPGDKEHTVAKIRKVVSGDTQKTTELIESIYASVITAGTFVAANIKTAEAAKVIENTQRDLNIALMNELALIFNRLGINIMDVLAAASTKWNFLPFRPGLVGGHCIGVDPYYLTHKAQSVGYHPEVILSGRRINDGMGAYIAGEVVRLMVAKGISPVRARILILGLAFKENCPDLRNTKVVDIISALKAYNIQVDVYDPCVDSAEAQHEYALSPLTRPELNSYDGVIVAVAHDEFRELGEVGIRSLGKSESVIYDVKDVLPLAAVDGRL